MSRLVGVRGGGGAEIYCSTTTPGSISLYIIQSCIITLLYYYFYTYFNINYMYIIIYLIIQPHVYN